MRYALVVALLALLGLAACGGGRDGAHVTADADRRAVASLARTFWTVYAAAAAADATDHRRTAAVDAARVCAMLDEHARREIAALATARRQSGCAGAVLDPLAVYQRFSASPVVERIRVRIVGDGATAATITTRYPLPFGRRGGRWLITPFTLPLARNQVRTSTACSRLMETVGHQPLPPATRTGLQRWLLARADRMKHAADEFAHLDLVGEVAAARNDFVAAAHAAISALRRNADALGSGKDLRALLAGAGTATISGDLAVALDAMHPDCGPATQLQGSRAAYKDGAKAACRQFRRSPKGAGDFEHLAHRLARETFPDRALRGYHRRLLATLRHLARVIRERQDPEGVLLLAYRAAVALHTVGAESCAASSRRRP